MKKLICFFTIFVFWGITDSMAQGLHFGVKAGVLGNKANISGMRDQFKEESLTGFQVGPMLQYQTGFHGIALDFSLLYVERGIKLTNTSNRRSADIKTQSIDIPIELKWEMGISNNFDLFLGVGPSFSFLVDKDNWGRKLAHIAVDVIDKDLLSVGWRSTEVGLNFRIIGMALASVREELETAYTASFITICFSAILMYYIERNAQPEVFKNIGDGIWWTIITFATVGYGDIYPITFLGKLLGCIICLVGVAMVAIPTGIISSSFINIVQKKEQREKFNKEEENRR